MKNRKKELTIKNTMALLIGLSLFLFSSVSIASDQFVSNVGIMNYTPTNILLKITGLEGESQIEGHVGEIDVLAWRWGATQSGSMHVGGGGGAGKVSVEDLSLTKLSDKASIGLLRACFSGTHFSEAILIVHKPEPNPMDYLVIKMSQVLVTSISTGENSAEEIVKEMVTLNFAKVEVNYTPIDPKTGAPGATMDFTWNIEKNVEE